MRFLTWNVNGRASKPTWSYIDHFLRPDVAFLQEAPPQERPELSHWLWSEIGDNSRYGPEGKYRWASGIGVYAGRLEPLPFEALGAGWVVGARHTVSDRVLTLLNVHVQFPKVGYSTTTLNRIIDALPDELAGRDVIFGGDLNVDVLWDEIHGTTRHGKVVGRLEEFGLFHVNTLLPPRTRTNRKTKEPYQIDHFFVSESLRELIQDVRVVAGSRVAALSDHFPVLLDLEIPTSAPA